MALDTKNYDPAEMAGATHQTASLAAASVTGAKFVTNLGYFTVAKNTNGTTPVDVIGSTNGFDATLTSILFSSRDDANGTIEVYSNVGTIARITTKGSLGVVKGTPLLNTSITSAGTLKAVSVNGTGSVTVIATFTVA